VRQEKKPNIFKEVSGFLKMYQIDSVLGHGTYGKVYGISSLLTRRPLALKRLLIDPKTKGDFVLSLREMDMMTRLVHPHIMPLTEVLFTPPLLSPLPEGIDDQVCFIMPRADLTLDKYIEKVSSMTSRKELIWQVLAGLQHIHRQNVIHRDLKPQNLLIFRELVRDVLRIGDFGLAVPYVQGEPRTPQMVTIWYRAPEILLGQDYNMKSDIWSLGCIFFELLTGRPLFAEEDEPRMINSILSFLPQEGSGPRHRFKTVSRRRRAFTPYPGVRGKVALLHKEIALSTSQITEFDTSPGTYRQFLELLSQLLTLDPVMRPSCTQLLRDVYFDGYREKLASIAVAPPIPHRLQLHPRRKVGIAIIDQQRYPIQYRVKFLAVDLLDRILSVDPSIGEDDLEIRRHAICALYIAEKYLMEERCCSFTELTSSSEEDFEGYEVREQHVLQSILQYRIYRSTLYDYLPPNVSSREISRAYLLFRRALPFSGMRLDELYAVYKYVVETYHKPVVTGDSIVIRSARIVTRHNSGQ
jgi:serine/threonine protein kinase